MQLIPNWRKAYKFLSVVAAAVGGVAYTVVEVANNVKSLGIELPDSANDIVVYATIASVIAGRLVQQPVVDGE